MLKLPQAFVKYYPPHAYARALVHPKKNFMGLLASAVMATFNGYMERCTFDTLRASKDDQILEVGFGPGIGLKYAAMHIERGAGLVYGVDHSSFMMAMASRRCRDEIKQAKLKLVQAALPNLPFPDQYFDGVFHCNCYPFWPDLSLACAEIFRLLRPGGYMTCGGPFEVAPPTLFVPPPVDVYINTDESEFLAELRTVGFCDVHCQEVVTDSNFSVRVIIAQRPRAETSFTREARQAL